MIEKRYDGNGNAAADVFSNTMIDWEYDNDGRLTSETGLYDSAPGDGADDFVNVVDGYADTYFFDLAGNRMSKAHYTTSTTEYTNYTYDQRDRLLSEDSTDNANGSQTSVTDSSGTKKYLWDLRNRMIAIDGNGDDLTLDTLTGSTSGTVNDSSDTNFTYDSSGVRTSEATAGTGGSTTYFLNDPQNPTGYTKAIEESTVTNGTTTTRSYILGNKVEAQSDATNGVLYLLTDGHGSTRALTSTSGAVIERYDYDAFGGAIGFNAANAKTTWLFGGDGIYDPASGWTYHLARWRDDFRFVSYDSFEADPGNPANLHKYAYLNENPTHSIDPSGHFTLVELLFVGLILTASAAVLYWYSGRAARVAKAVPIRPITINIYMPSRAPHKLPMDCPKIALQLTEQFSPVTKGMLCPVTFNVLNTAPPANLGWTMANKYKSVWNGKLIVNDSLPGFAFQSPNSSSGEFNTVQLLNYVDLGKDNNITPNYPAMWANLIAHEMIDHGIVGESDEQDVPDIRAGNDLYIGELAPLPPGYAQTFKEAIQGR